LGGIFCLEKILNAGCFKFVTTLTNTGNANIINQQDNSFIITSRPFKCPHLNSNLRKRGRLHFYTAKRGRLAGRCVMKTYEVLKTS
jgi:hypothetical protein